MDQKFSIQICQFPGNSSTHPHASDWVAETLYKAKKDPRIERVGRFRVSDTPIPMVRNAAVKEALDGGYDYILMIDSDMGPDYEVGVTPNARPFWDTSWDFMMGCRKEDLPPATIAAPYCGPPPNELVYVFRWKNQQSEHPNPDMRLGMIEREDAAQRAGIEEVAALPTGLILYDARVFNVMEDAGVLPWFDYEYTDKYNRGKATTEDVFQTRNAYMLGLPQYVLWDSWALHYKLKAVHRPVAVTRKLVSSVMARAAISKYESPEDKLMVVNRNDPQFSVVADPSTQAEEEAAVRESGQQLPGVGRPDRPSDCAEG